MAKTTATPDDVLEISGNPMLPRLLAALGFVSLVIGVVCVVRVHVSLGMYICVAAAVAGGIWLWRLPVKLRLTPKGLHFLTTNRPAIRWLDMERVSVPEVSFRGLRFLCIRPSEDHPLRGPQTGESMLGLMGRLYYDFDIVLRSDQYALSVDWLLHEFNRRISLAHARERMEGAQAAPPLECREAGPVKIDSATAMAIPEDLGTRGTIFPPSHSGARRSILAGLAMVVFGIVVMVGYHVRPPQPGEETGMFFVLYGIGGASIACGLVFVLRALLVRGQTFSVYEHGFLVQERAVTHVCYWQDIAVVQVCMVQGILWHRPIDVVEFGDGQKVKIDPLRVTQALDLAARIGHAVGRRLAPQVLARLNENTFVAFGPLVLMRAGVQAGRVFYPWTELRDIHADRSTGIVFVQSAGTAMPSRFQASEVPNLAVVAAVVELVNEHLGR